MKYFSTLPVVFFIALSSLLFSNYAYATDNNCNCDNNVLKNSSFESIDSQTKQPKDWTFVSQKTGATFGYDDDYSVCGTKNGLLHYKGYIYQDVPLEGGFTVTLSIWGGYHNKSGQKFELKFYNSSNDQVGSTITQDLDKSVTQGSGPHGMTLYNLTGVAPADAKYVRLIGSLTDAYQGKGDYLKIDQACLILTPPPAGCSDCTANKLVNPSFELTETKNSKIVPKNWVGSSRFISDAGYKVCGEKNGLINDGAGSFYQDVASAEGDEVSLKIWGGYHVFSDHKFELIFYSGANAILQTESVNLDKSVESLSNHLKLYSLAGTAPAGTAYVRVKGSSTGNFFKVDFACLTIKSVPIPPADCESCKDNALLNPSFENKTGDQLSDWTFFAANNDPKSNISTFTQDNAYNACGSYNGLMHYSGKFYQDVALTNGFKVDLKIWGGYHNQSGQKFQLIFLDENKGKLGDSVEVALNKRVEDTPKTEPHGMTQYTLSATAPAGAKFVRVQGIGTGDYFKVDFGCLTLTPPPPLPVTLVEFKVASEQNQANLIWSTVSEINAISFDIEHSGDGKQWTNLGSVAAKGESNSMITYNFVDRTPFVGNNLYRLKMIDADRTFAYSKIVNFKFEGGGMTIFPNPASSKIRLTETIEKVEKVQIYNLSGVVMLQAVPDSSNEIDLSRIPQGAYTVRVYKSGGSVTSHKIQVIK